METKEQGTYLSDFQGIIGNIMENLVDEMYESRASESGSEPSIRSAAPQTAMNIEEMKKVIGSLQAYLSKVTVAIDDMERGQPHYIDQNDAFMKDFISTADNMLEAATLVMHDPLTGLANVRGFDSRLSIEWNRAVREQQSLGLVVIGIDGFSEKAQKYGETTTNMGITRVAQIIKHAIKRSTDMIARINDEEFAAILPNTEFDGTSIVAERIREEIANMVFTLKDGTPLKITTSVGMCVMVPTQDERPNIIVERALAALINAKNTGTNKVVNG